MCTNSVNTVNLKGVSTIISIDKLSRVPIYEQIIQQIRKLVIKDFLNSDDLLPSIRVLSQDISVNPNTLQKAYSELERQGICYSVPGTGRYISKNAKKIIKEDTKKQIIEIKRLSKELAEINVDINEIFDCVKQSYEQVGRQLNDYSNECD